MLEKLWKRCTNRETISYLIFGVLTTAVDWVVFTLLRETGSSVAFSTNLAWAASVAFAFVTNKIYVFQSRGKSCIEVLRELISFVGCRLFTWAFSLCTMVRLVDQMGWNDYISKALVSVAVLVLNYIFSKLLIFKSHRYT